MKWKMLIIWLVLFAVGILVGKFIFKSKPTSTALTPVKLYEAQGGDTPGLAGADTALAGFKGEIIEVHDGDKIQDERVN